MNKISFLFGAGFSIPVKLPSTSEITKQIVSGKNVKRHTDGTYYIDKGSYSYNQTHYYQKYVEPIISLIRKVNSLLCEYQQNKPNYEDIYYIISQIHDNHIGNYDNPIVYPFLDILKIDEIKGNLTVSELLRETTNYINDIVRYLLINGFKEKNLQDFSFLKKIINTFDVNIFTLNHDLVLETWLKQNHIKYIDGFGQPDKGIRFWQPNLFDQSSILKIYKLHGSINWARFTKDGLNEDIIGCLTEDYCQENTHPLHLQNFKILTGVHNKMLEYTSSLFTDLFCRFWRTLDKTHVLIVSGYSFGDKGVNSRIIHWLNSKEAKMLIIHPDIEELKRTVRGAIINNWDSWHKNDKLFLIEKGIEDLSYNDINKYLV